MLRPIDSITLADSPARTAAWSTRPDAGAAERPSSDTAEQTTIAVRKPAALARGSRAPAASPNGGQVAPKAPAVAQSSAAHSTVASTNGVNHPVSGEDIVKAASSLPANPEAAIRDLMRIREEALTPPTTPADLELAARAALDVQRAQQELAREKYAREAGATTPATATQAPHPTTDVTA